LALWATVAQARAVDSYLNITASGANDISLTVDQAAAREILFSGAQTGNLNVIFPLASVDTGQTWVLASSCSGGFTLTAKAATGTGVVLTTGTATRVYWDGTNLVAAQTNVVSMGAAERGANTSITALTGITSGLSMTGGLNTDVVKGNNVALAFGYLTKTITDADYTLSAAEMANTTLDITGPLTAQRKIILPLTAGAIYVVFNNASTQNLNFIGSTGTGIVVANNKRAILHTAGTNWNRVTADT
jgi:hypothetical protein